jgi:hypothetical protein
MHLDQLEPQFQHETIDAEVMNDGGNNGFNIRNSFIIRHFM